MALVVIRSAFCTSHCGSLKRKHETQTLILSNTSPLTKNKNHTHTHTLWVHGVTFCIMSNQKLNLPLTDPVYVRVCVFLLLVCRLPRVCCWLQALSSPPFISGAVWVLLLLSAQHDYRDTDPSSRYTHTHTHATLSQMEGRNWNTWGKSKRLKWRMLDCVCARIQALRLKLGGTRLLWTGSYLFPIMSNGWVDKCAIWWVCLRVQMCGWRSVCAVHCMYFCSGCVFLFGVVFHCSCEGEGKSCGYFLFWLKGHCLHSMCVGRCVCVVWCGVH